MRIVCQLCSAAYSIDDRHLSAPTLRAQCPRCRHVQLVRGNPPAAPSLAGGPGPVLNDRDFELALASAAQTPPNPTPAPDFEDPFADIMNESPAEGDASTANPPNEVGSSGLFDWNRSELSPGASAPRVAPSGAARAPAASVGNLVAAQSEEGSAIVALPSSPRVAPAPAPAPAPIEEAFEELPAPGGKGRLVWIAMAGLLLGGGGAVLLIRKPWVQRAPPLAVQIEVAPADAVIARWKQQWDGEGGNAAELVQAGKAKLKLDRTTAYREAEREFQRAVVLEPKNDAAIVGYVNAAALGRGDELTEEDFHAALALVTAAEGRGGASPEELVAHANLLLTRPDSVNLSDARALAQRALGSPEKELRAAAYLALGRSYLGTNQVWASENFDKAIAADSSLRQGYLYRARAARAAGDPAAAIQNLETRLALDPDQWEATELLTRAYVEIGEPALARRALERARDNSPHGDRAKLTIGVLLYQHEGKAAQGAEALDSLNKQLPRTSVPLKVEVLGHLAAARRVAGQWDAASAAANEALTLVQSDLQARLQLFLIALKRGQLEQARGQFILLEGKLGDAVLEQLLEGRLLMGEVQFAQALAAFSRAVELDARRTDAMLLAAAAAAALGQERQAYEWVLQRAMRAEPLRVSPAEVLARHFVAPADLLEGVVGALNVLRSGPDDPNPLLANGLVQFHLGELSAADRSLAQVLSIDPSNGPAWALRALIAVRQGKASAASTLANKAVAAGRQSALAQHADGEAKFLAGQLDESKKAFREALQLDPKLLAPRIRLGVVESRLGNREEARRLLQSVVGIDQTYLDAHQALYNVPK